MTNTSKCVTCGRMTFGKKTLLLSQIIVKEHGHDVTTTRTVLGDLLKKYVLVNINCK